MRLPDPAATGGQKYIAAAFVFVPIGDAFDVYAGYRIAAATEREYIGRFSAGQLGDFLRADFEERKRKTESRIEQTKKNQPLSVLRKRKPQLDLNLDLSNLKL